MLLAVPVLSNAALEDAMTSARLEDSPEASAPPRLEVLLELDSPEASAPARLEVFLELPPESAGEVFLELSPEASAPARLEVFLALSPELEVSPERLFQPSHLVSGSSV